MIKLNVAIKSKGKTKIKYKMKIGLKKNTEPMFGVFVGGSLQFFSKSHEQAVKVATEWTQSSQMKIWLLEIDEKTKEIIEPTEKKLINEISH